LLVESLNQVAHSSIVYGELNRVVGKLSKENLPEEEGRLMKLKQLWRLD